MFSDVLTPTIHFLYYINELPNSIHHSQYHLYADDLQINQFFQPTAILEMTHKLQEDIDNINTLAVNNGLSQCKKKTKAIQLFS